MEELTAYSEQLKKAEPEDPKVPFEDLISELRY